MTFTLIIMDSLYIMRNLLMIFFLMVVFWTNLGNCEGPFLEIIPKPTTPLGVLPFEPSTTTYDTTTTPAVQASSCDEPAPPDDLVSHIPDFAEGEMYANGTEIMYDCPDGFDLNGHMTAVCLHGVWTYENAYCTASKCDEPALPDDLVFHRPDFAEGEMYAHGTEIMYDCPGGFDLNGHMTAVCLYGVWTYEDAYCTGVCDNNTQCYYDETRMHSTVSCYIETDGNTAHPCYGDGSIITCSCNSENYQLSSPDNSYQCSPDEWEDGLYDLQCLGSVCDKYTQCHYDETRMHSNVSCHIETDGNTAPPCYGDGSIITCSCNNENYQLSSPDDSYLCRPDKWEDGLYDLYCLRILYSKDPAPPHFGVIQTPQNGGGWKNGSSVSHSCPNGYILPRPSRSVCLCGRWNEGTEPICPDFCDKYTQCHYDETRVHPTVICINETAGNTAPPCRGAGSNIPCSCNSENYQLSSPDISHLCRLGKWKDGLYDLHCWETSPCHEPAPPDDLVIHSPDFAEGEIYANGTEIMYDCPDGWDFNGNMTAVCLYGVWTYKDAYCTASSCDEPAPPDDLVSHSPDFAEGEMYTNGTEIMYDCPDGWDFNGKMTAVCLHGVWTYEDAYCTASSCHEPAPPDDLVSHSPNFAEGEMYANGTEIMYDCPKGRALNGNMTAVCLHGVWTHEDAYCTASPCHEPAPPDDLVIHSPDFAEGEMYANGTEIMYDCPDGWDVNGNMTAVCLYGVWTYEDAYCTASSCHKPAPPDDLVIHSPDFAEGEMYAHGTEIVYDCPDGWDLNGHMTAVCLYGVWTYEDAYCTDSPCKDPAPANVDVIVTPQNGEDEGKSGSRVSYSCPNGYILHGSRSAVCLNGRWIVETVPSCSASPCCAPAKLHGLVILNPDFAKRKMHPNGTEIMYGCPDRLFFKANISAVCLYGVWTTYEDAYCIDWCLILIVLIIAIFTLLLAVLLIWLVKKHCLRRGTKWIPSVEGVANEQVPPTANDESKFVSKVTFEMRDPNAYQNDVNKEENDVTDHVGDNSPDDSPNNDPEEETV